MKDMSLIPQGVSGGTVGGGNPSAVFPSNLVSTGAIYHLGRWTGQTLRKLVLSSATNGLVYGRIQIATDYPRGGLHPGQDALPNPLVDIPFVLSPSFPMLNLDFDPGLVTVLPGESIYLIVYDFMGKLFSAVPAMTWGLSMFWEPFGGAK